MNLPIALLLLILPSQTLTQGLQGHWKFDEAAGPSLDSSGNGRHATWNTGVSAAAPSNATIVFPNPNCVQLAGNGQLTVPYAAGLDITGDLTLSLWVRPDGDASDWQRLAGKGSQSNSRTYGIWREGGSGHRLLWQGLGPSNSIVFNFFSNGSLPNNAWTHVCCTVKGGTATIYLNGAASGSGDLTGSMVAGPDPVTFGYAGYHSAFPGKLDDLRIYNRALSGTEITTLSSGQGGQLPPKAPTLLKVVDAATSSPLATGGTLTQPAAVLTATVTTPGGNPAGLQAEVQPVGTAFSNAPNRPAGTLVASTTNASVAVTGLAFLTDYHAQLRAVDAEGQVSAWVGVGGNPESEKDFATPSAGPPPVLTVAQAVDPSTGSALRSGASVIQKTILVRAFIADGTGTPLRMGVEVAAAGSAFRGVATAVSGEVGAGGLAEVEIAVTAGPKIVQVMAFNGYGVESAWMPLGGDPDVVVVGVGSEGQTLGDMLSGGASCLGSAAGGGQALLLLALLVSAPARRGARGSSA